MSSMRVCFTIDSLKLGGAERILLKWASWCKDEGWQVLVITRQTSAMDAYPVPEGVERWVESSLSPSLERLGWFAFPFRVLALRQLLQRHRSDVVVGVTTLPVVKLLLASLCLPVRAVAAERNYPPAKPLSLPWRWLRRITYSWADLHFVQTRQTGVWLRQHCDVRRQQLLPNPVTWPLPDREPFLHPDDCLSPQDPLILAAGTKAFQKGFDRLMPIFAELALHYPRLHLAILGINNEPYHGLDQHNWLRQLLGDCSDLQTRFLMPGVSGSMSCWYSRATLFVLPSRYEGFPNVLLEAMASGSTCIASDCCTGPADLIHHGDNGLLLSPNAKVCDWVDAISSLLEDPERSRRLGARASEVRERFNENSVRRVFVDALRRSLCG